MTYRAAFDRIIDVLYKIKGRHIGRKKRKREGRRGVGEDG